MTAPTESSSYETSEHADTYENHTWRSEFASTRSGRNSPNIFATFRRKFLMSPPVRTVKSPRFTDEELDALTGDLPYETNYTYAFSKAYDPSLPDHWEVPNLRGSIVHQSFSEEHYSAASLSRQFFHIVTLPIVFIVHILLFILQSIRSGATISVLTIWEYIVYCIKRVYNSFSDWYDLRQRSSLSRRIHQQSLWERVVQIISMSSAWVWNAVTFGPRMLFGNEKETVEQYNYKPIKGKLEQERLSRMGSYSSNNGSSPTTRTRSQVMRMSQDGQSSTSSSYWAEEEPQEETRELPMPRRTIRNRSITPARDGGIASSIRARKANFEREDTPLSTYGLRSRVSAVARDTPEPTNERRSFRSMDQSQEPPISRPNPLFGHDQKMFFASIGNKTTNIVSEGFRWLAYIILIPFFAIRHVAYLLYDKVGGLFESDPYAAAVADRKASLRSRSERIETEETYSTELNTFNRAAVLVWRATSWLLYTIFHWFTDPLYMFGEYILSLLAYLKKPIFWKIAFQGICALLFLIFCCWLLFTLTAKTQERIDEDGKVIKTRDYGSPIFRTHPREVWADVKTKALNAYYYSIATFYKYVIRPAFITYARIEDGLAASGSIGAAIYKYTLGPVVHFARVIKNTVINIVFEFYAFFAGTPNHIRNFGGKVYNAVTESVGDIWHMVANFMYYTCRSIYNLYRFLAADFARFIIRPIVALFVRIFEWFSTSSSKAWNIVPSKSDASHMVHSFTGMIQSAGDTFYMWTILPLIKLSEKRVHDVDTPIPDEPRKVVMPPNALNIDMSVPPMVEVPVPNANPAHHVTNIEDVKLDANVNQKTANPTTEKPREVVVPPNIVNIDASVPPPPQVTVPIPVMEPVQPPTKIDIDQAALIADITEKIRSEMAAKFQSFESSYKLIIQKLTTQNTNIQVDYTNLEAMVRQMIYEYDADKTGQVDYALESAGASVISTRCSETFNTYSRLEKIWNIPLWYSSYGPRTVIQRNSKTLFPGECWSFKNDKGYLTIELSHYIDVSSVSYEHIGKEIAPNGNRESAPKSFKVWAYKQVDDLKTRVMIGEYKYDIDGPPLQFFIARNKPDYPVKIIELEVTSNYGAIFTCLYRLRVHGKIADVN